MSRLIAMLFTEKQKIIFLHTCPSADSPAPGKTLKGAATLLKLSPPVKSILGFAPVFAI